MSATGLEVVTFEFPSPSANPQPTSQFQRVNASISFDYIVSGSVVSLSSNTATAGADVVGFLYYPALAANDPCTDAAAPYVPSNVTQRTDLPSGYDLVAVAPWLSPDCTLSYLRSVQPDPITAFIFFIPGQGTQAPPSATDAAWNLGDGGEWKSDNHYPVYAIPSDYAETILDQMADCSGNLTNAPYADQLISIYKPSDYVRLYVDIRLSGGGGLPSIWVFLLIILAILLAVIGFMSLCLHYVQRRRRTALRRRIVNGEIDVETLGIKKLTVPQDRIDKMPAYLYGAKSGQAQSSNYGISGADNLSSDHAMSKGESAVAVSQPPTSGLFQPACAICIDDFLPGESRVRELPCKHIFHPECIDMFLLENSSLCPLCKKSVLPKGYCPTKVTNQMVRRERNARRLMERRNQSAAYVNEQANASGRSRFAFFARRNTRPSPNTAHTPEGTVEMVSIEPTVPPGPAPTHGRSEWARRRALAMLGPRAPAPETTAEEEEAGRRVSGPRKLLGRVFPGVGLGFSSR
ncbi:hypothetical protein MBLNU459_g3751t1 [Dothideomycetes sp. NU459]